MGLAMTERGNKDTLVPKGIKYGGINTKRTEFFSTLFIAQTFLHQGSTENFKEISLHNADSLCKGT